jgi:hypothetical protein
MRKFENKRKNGIPLDDDEEEMYDQLKNGDD